MIKLNMKRLLKLLAKEFPDVFVTVQYGLRAGLPTTPQEYFSAYIADHAIFSHGSFKSASSPEFETIARLTAFVKESILNYRIAQSVKMIN
jgi:hypothetical protein